MFSKSRARYVDAYLISLKCKLLAERRDESTCDRRIGTDLTALRRVVLEATREHIGDGAGLALEINLISIDPQAYATPDALRLVDQLQTAFRNLVSAPTKLAAYHYN